ncbi:sugar phosphate isomerase/epimerase family protein [Lacrimispora xylanisolvens]|uniref:sugar phosphate isomerase/epimerase family protein n=1 Tax=Lacrimispora xylanisolvens TaxID=384636 RepID=UPI002402C400
MKMAISNIAWDPQYNEEVFSMMENYHYVGLEIAPSIIVGEDPYSKYKEAKKIAEKIKGQYGFLICSMQSIWYGMKEEIFADEQQREVLKRYTYQAINFAHQIGCPNMVFGCPKNRNLYHQGDYSIAVDFFREVGDLAYRSGTTLALEANPIIYGTNFLNKTEDVLEIIKEINSPGIKLNLDLGTIIYNNEDISMLIGQGEWINHVHISEPGLKIIESRKLHEDLRRILIAEGYKNYISIEMGKQENLVELKSSLKYIKSIFG